MGPVTAGLDWFLDFWLANRGTTAEFFKVILLPQGSQQPILSGDLVVEPLQTGSFNLTNDAGPDIVVYEQWWARIFTTSLNLVPTMRLNVEGTLNPPNPNFAGPPEFFFGPGDFAVFPLPPRFGPQGGVLGTGIITQ